MNEQNPKLIWGVVSVGIYVFIVGIVVYYFNTREEKKPVNYVKKNEHRIQVALSAPKKEKIVKQKPVSKPKPKPQVKPKKKVEKPKPKSKPKATPEKKIKKEKVVKKVKKKDTNLTKPKPKKASDLFSKVKTPKPKEKKLIQLSDKPVDVKPKKNLIKVTDDPKSASQRIAESLKQQKSMQSGEENAYFAKVQAMLEAWPAQSQYAGEKATVLLYIKPSGKFEFQVTSGSDVDSFNVDLLTFLKQLQQIGFGRHNAGRTYEFEAEFIAKE